MTVVPSFGSRRTLGGGAFFSVILSQVEGSASSDFRWSA
jgi:hypothetical protein